MILKTLTYYFNVFCECFCNDEPKSPPAYRRELIDTFRIDEDEQDENLRYTRFYLEDFPFPFF